MVPDGIWAFLLGWLLTLPTMPMPAPDPPSPPEFPIVGRVSYARTHHDYPATDVFARCGSKVVAPVDGTVLEVTRVDRWDPATDRGADRGGKSFSIRGRDGVRYYGSHLSRVADRLRPGTTVRAGDLVGEVGSTGSAQGIACHLHLGLSPVCRGTGDWRVRRGVVDPFPFLRSWQRGGARSPERDVKAWQRRHGCPGGASAGR